VTRDVVIISVSAFHSHLTHSTQKLFISYIPATLWADRQTHNDGIYCASIASCGKNCKSPTNWQHYGLGLLCHTPTSMPT